MAISHDDAAGPVLVLDAGTGLRQVTPLLGGGPFTGTILLTHLHWDHVHGLPFFRGGDRDDARVTLLLPAQESGESAAAALARGMSPPHFPIGPEGLRGDWTFGSLDPGPLKAEGFTVEAREVPHKGGRTYGYRVSDGHSVLTYIPDHCPTVLGPGPEGLGEYHPRRAGPGGRHRPADPRRVPAGQRGARRGGVRSRGGASTRPAWDGGPGRGGWRWPTTSPAGPTTSWTRWPARSPPAALRDPVHPAQAHRPHGHGARPEIFVAAEGGILEL